MVFFNLSPIIIAIRLKRKCLFASFSIKILYKMNFCSYSYLSLLAMNGVRRHRLEVEKVVSLHLMGQKLLGVSLQVSTQCYFNKILSGNGKESDSLPILHHALSGSIASSS